eukprot:TRINITY_DN3341_c0_g1_i1.p1 TRINITY_DN3341_c0_g1~~TRINITY_DN3341_c0_g1_i1.p1  ORF type:complete len:318 (+),score=74.00 TRINITY_DN3341_c0_g1_i1:64-1017(+)
MEGVEAIPQKIVKDGESLSGLAISLHPLVIINISDHFTRTKVMTKRSDVRVIGALLGTVTGRKVEIYNSFELDYNMNLGRVNVNEAYFKSKQEQMKKVFPTHEVLGWYSSGCEPTFDDLDVQKLVSGYCESPLYLLLDNTQRTVDQVPVKIYESESSFLDGLLRMNFVCTSYKMETVESERIAVEHVANISATGSNTTSAFSKQTNGIQNALKQLLDEVKIITDYLAAVKAGSTPVDLALLREISALWNMIPAGQLSSFRQDITVQHADVVLVSYLASMTKGIHQLNELSEKVKSTYPHSSISTMHKDKPNIFHSFK